MTNMFDVPTQRNSSIFSVWARNGKLSECPLISLASRKLGKLSFYH